MKVINVFNFGILMGICWIALIDAAAVPYYSVDTFAGVQSSSGGFSGDGGDATSAVMKVPFSVWMNRNSELFIADAFNSRIRKVGSDKVMSTYAGNGALGGGVMSGPATSASFSPTGVCGDSTGVIYIADPGTSVNHIHKVDTAGIISLYAGAGANAANTASAGDDGPATSATMTAPAFCAVDQQGNLFISVYVNGKIRMVSKTTQIISLVAGTGLVNTNAGEDGPATSGNIKNPYGIFVDTSGVVYVGEQTTCRLLKINTNTHSLSVFAGAWNVNTATTGDGGSATSATFKGVIYVGGDGGGNIVTGEQHRLRIIPKATNIISTIAGTSDNGFGGDGGAATSALFYANGQHFVYGTKVFVPDGNNMVVRVLTATSSASASPSVAPTAETTAVPTLQPTASPSLQPSVSPSQGPTAVPSVPPTTNPSMSPSISPTLSPTTISATPSVSPTCMPSAPPTTSPTKTPSAAPSNTPTLLPSAGKGPTLKPTRVPTARPTFKPTVSLQPTTAPVVVIQFNTILSLDNLMSNTLDGLAQQAIINATAVSMGVSMDSITYLGGSFTTSLRKLRGSNVATRALTPQTFDFIIMLQIIASTAEVTGFSNTGNATALFIALRDKLADATTSGDFIDALHSSSAALGASTTLSASGASATTSSSFTVVDTDGKDDSSDGGLTTGGLIGVIIGAVVLVVIIGSIAYVSIKNKKENRVGVSGAGQ